MVEVLEDRGRGALGDNDGGDSWPGNFFLVFCKIKTLYSKDSKSFKIVLRYKQLEEVKMINDLQSVVFRGSPGRKRHFIIESIFKLL